MIKAFLGVISVFIPFIGGLEGFGGDLGNKKAPEAFAPGA
jgi:hypothetical protein